MKTVIRDIFLKQMLSIQKFLFNLHCDLPFCKLVCNIHNQENCCGYENFKTSIKSWINTKKVHKVTQFNQKAWLKPHIDMATKLRTGAKK